MIFFLIAIDHCEGPDHLQRMRAIDPRVEEIVAKLPEHLSGSGARLRAQHARATEIIATFGRHPHRNEVLSRPSTFAEERYIAEGDFPHLPKRT